VVRLCVHESGLLDKREQCLSEVPRALGNTRSITRDTSLPWPAAVLPCREVCIVSPTEGCPTFRLLAVVSGAQTAIGNIAVPSAGNFHGALQGANVIVMVHAASPLEQHAGMRNSNTSTNGSHVLYWVVTVSPDASTHPGITIRINTPTLGSQPG
jgi:hypothetical protein